MQIIITPEDIEKAKISHSASGRVIDELAFAAKQWTEMDLFDNNIDYMPREPYDFDFEADLLENTKSWKDLCIIMGTMDNLSLCEEDYELHKLSGLQAGAWLALNYANKWGTLLKGWEDILKEEGTDSPSKEWNKELDKAIASSQDDLYKEWLNGGQQRDNNGVVYEISKYFTDNTDGNYDNETDIYTFEIENPHEMFCNCYEDDCKDYSTEETVKARLLNDIDGSSYAHSTELKANREKNQAVHAKEKEYRERVAIAEAESRKAKLLALKL